MTDTTSVPAPAGEREIKSTIIDDTFDEIHTRIDTTTFLATKRMLDAAGVRCCITGLSREEAKEFGENIEEHHTGLEYSLQFGVNWDTVKAVALGQITELPCLHPKTSLPLPGKTAPAKGFLFFWFLEWTKARGFDWNAFDPAKPETFVDSVQQMIPLITNVHTGGHGVHRHSAPVWLFLMWPRKEGFIYFRDEEGTHASNAAS
jgi:hypothetical protein